MTLQNIVEIAEEIKYLQKARDLLRDVQWCLNKQKGQFSQKQIDDINTFFHYDEDRVV